MYYKIENKESEVYKKLYELRTKELEINKRNKIAVVEKIGQDFETFLGNTSQQQWSRVTSYSGFKFNNIDILDKSIWIEHKDFNGLYLPNRKTKKGREIDEFLRNGLETSIWTLVWDIFGLEHIGKFQFPYVEIIGEIIIIYLDEKQEPKDENLIEITKKEFDLIFESGK